MDQYTPDIWYDTSKFKYDKKLDMLLYALNLSKGKQATYHIDKLDCAVSFARQDCDMTFNEIVEKLTDKCHFVCVYRKGYESWKELNDFSAHKRWCLELGFATEGIKEPTYFLWMYINEIEIPQFIKKFKLKVKS